MKKTMISTKTQAEIEQLAEWIFIREAGTASSPGSAETLASNAFSKAGRFILARETWRAALKGTKE